VKESKRDRAGRALAASERSENDLIADFKKERMREHGYKRLLRRLRTRLKRLKSQDPNIYPLW
jgi:hypothetical protein